MHLPMTESFSLHDIVGIHGQTKPLTVRARLDGRCFTVGASQESGDCYLDRSDQFSLTELVRNHSRNPGFLQVSNWLLTSY
jgi:hypothetical protein